MWDSILDYLAENASKVAFGSTFAASLLGVGVDKNWGTRWVVPWIIGLGFAALLSAVSVRRNRLQQGRRAAIVAIGKVLAACASAFGHPQQHIRVNLMFVDGTKRRVHQVTAFNMADDPDVDLELDATAGVSGGAYISGTAAYGDLTLGLTPGGPTWGLNASQKAKVRPTLKSILSAPVFSASNPAGAPIATLQLDSDEPLTVTAFDDLGKQQVAERFADVVSLLLQSAE